MLSIFNKLKHSKLLTTINYTNVYFSEVVFFSKGFLNCKTVCFFIVISFNKKTKFMLGFDCAYCETKSFLILSN